MNYLRDQEFKFCYRTDEDNLLGDFFVPALCCAIEYKRAVGFFSGSSFRSLSRGLIELLKNNGTIKIIASPLLAEADIAAISKGYLDRVDAITKNCEDIIEALSWGKDIEAIAWLIASRKLDLKIAFCTHSTQNGIYHEKLGIIKDASGDFLAFSGSANESISAHEYNFETIDVDMSWDDRRNVTAQKERHFDKLWNNETALLTVIPFPKAAEEKLLKKRKSTSIEAFIEDYDDDNIENDISIDSADINIPCIPSEISLYSYQTKALQKWREHHCHGILKMATGTGKTITALSAAMRLLDAHQKAPSTPSLAIIIVCPYKHLVSQWSKECKRFNFKFIKCFGSRNSWFEHAVGLAMELQHGAIHNYQHVCFITTNTSFAKAPFQQIIERLMGNILIIVDEAHNIGTETQLNSLPDKAQFRLALSATPERWFDDEGTEAIKQYFGDVILDFGLKEALEFGCLTPYYYHPVIVSFTETESERYIALSRQLQRLMSVPEDHRSAALEEQLKRLLLRRARLQASAYNKSVKLKEIISDKYIDKKHILVYCGDGSVESDVDLSTTKQTELVVGILGNELRMRVDSFTSENSLHERDVLQKRFADGDLQALIAIRCLDEGVDIPATQTAFILASSTNPRQFIQRRGRVLRKSKGKEFAEIYDFIVILNPEECGDSEIMDFERSLLKKELARINEFSHLAKNKAQANAVLLDLKKTYNLLDI